MSEMAFKFAIFTLNQWALDFEGNVRRILKSIDMAAQGEAMYRAGPELEICGYSLEDAFFEPDTLRLSWEGLIQILNYSAKMDLIIDIGMPVQFVSLYNCRVICYKRKILCIRSKTDLALEGNYRENRHFTPWIRKNGLVAYRLPDFVSSELGQSHVPFGSDFILELSNINSCDTFRIGWEICQELWVSKNTSSSLYQDFGCHLVVNSSASYWQLRKLSTLLDMAKGVSLRGGACYAYSNCVGCDGQRYVFYGRSCIFDRGQCVAMTSTTSDVFNEIQMITHEVIGSDIDATRAKLGIRPSRFKSKGSLNLNADVKLTDIDKNINRLQLICPRSGHCKKLTPNAPLMTTSMRFEQEIHTYVSLWLWDYLRRSRMIGFIVPLSGGLDSSSVATLVFSMCNFLYKNLHNPSVIDYFVTIHKFKKDDLSSKLSSPEAICETLLKCIYLGTKYSSVETLNRSKKLSQSIGAKSVNINFQEAYDFLRNTLRESKPSNEITLLDQNMQARIRMLSTYDASEGKRIVLATGNVDEAIVGYLTKYDCSSADINPIGGLCKNDLKSYLIHCCDEIYRDKPDLVDVLREIIAAPPSAELTGSDQRDEDEIGLTYDEISILGKVRNGIYGPNGPLGAFEYLWIRCKSEPFCNMIRCFSGQFEDDASRAQELSKLVKRFYQRYTNNRHKLTILTPALHAETYSPDDNRFDHRQFLYPPLTNQFKAIDRMVESLRTNNRI